jgi:diguanylate cyclase (GGDEF)-like protein
MRVPIARFGAVAAPADPPTLLHSRVNRRLWLSVLLASTAASALMALVAGLLVLSNSARQLQRQADGLQRQLSVGLTSYEPLHNLQRRLQQSAASREVTSALVVDQRGLVLAASNNALVDLPLPHLLQLPQQRQLQELFVGCPSASTLITCLSRDRQVFHGPLPWIGSESLLTLRQYPLALEGIGRFGDRATLITVIDARPALNDALVFVLQVFVAGLLPLMAGCVILMLLLRRALIPELLQMAQIDGLSGIYNRRAFTETATEQLHRAQQARLPMTLALIDVDHFKQINDRHGHDAGDQVIRAVSELLRRAVRSGDLVGRLGGDEFVILVQLPGDAATQMLDRTREVILAQPIATGDTEPIHVSLSVGVAATSGAGGYDLTALLSSADAALYVAKDRGRAQVVNLEPSSSLVSAGAVLPFGDWQIRGR